MGTSFVHINEKGFWMQDSVLELWLRLLALHIEDDEEGSTGHRIRDQWLLASRGFFGGFIPHNLEGAVSTDDGRAIVLAAIESLQQALRKGPAELDQGTLNLIGFKHPVFAQDCESVRLLEVGEAFKALIAGEINSDASSTEFMPGSRPIT